MHLTKCREAVAPCLKDVQQRRASTVESPVRYVCCKDESAAKPGAVRGSGTWTDSATPQQPQPATSKHSSTTAIGLTIKQQAT